MLISRHRHVKVNTRTIPNGDDAVLSQWDFVET
jgi:hypothetical protein